VGMDKSKITMLLKGKTFTTPGTFNEKGTGIGLLLSKELLERNAGTLAIASKIGMGTKIEIILPAYQMSNN
ncbi:MAG: sensor histidine kinase, partial [Terrimonas sp.]|nr:sensor histidine kinase [Terrimonas sp.]